MKQTGEIDSEGYRSCRLCGQSHSAAKCTAVNTRTQLYQPFRSRQKLQLQKDVDHKKESIARAAQDLRNL